MGDFFQPGVVTTLHRLRKNSLDRRETELEFFSRYNPIALVLPSLYCELKEKALKTIVSEVQKMKYITQVIVTLGRAKEKEFEHAKEFFSVLPQETIVIWNDGERVRSLYDILTKNDISAGVDGKGRSVLASEGIDLSESQLKILKATYLRTAQEAITKYHDDAAINGLEFDRHEEEEAVEAFTKGIKIAGKAFVEDPLSIPLITNWSRVTSAIPDFLEKLKNAVDDDNT